MMNKFYSVITLRWMEGLLPRFAMTVASLGLAFFLVSCGGNTETGDLSGNPAPEASSAELEQGWGIYAAEAEYVLPFPAYRPLVGIVRVYFFRPIDNFVCRVYKDKKKASHTRKANGKLGVLEEEGTVGWHVIKVKGVGQYALRGDTPIRSRTVVCDEAESLPDDVFPEGIASSKTRAIAPEVFF